MSGIPVTVIIPVKDEERNLEKCLGLLSDFCQIIVVDSQSTDDTVQIARSFGAEVQQFHWNGKFPKKRNWALRNLTIKNEWVFFLDADEYVTNAFLSEMQKKIKNSSINGYWVTYQVHFMDKKLNYGDKLKKLSLFRHDKGEYEKIEEDSWSHLDMEVHEQAVVEGETGQIQAPVDHRDYKGLEKYIDRHNQYSSWQARRFVNLSKDEFKSLSWRKWLKYCLMQVGVLPVVFFIGCYFLKLGFLDGREGFYYAVYKSYYFFQVQTKIKESLEE